MKKFCITGVIFVALFSFSAFPTTRCLAAEPEGVTGVSYLTFISSPPYLEIFSFNSDGTTFNMVTLEEQTPGAGTFIDNGILFSAKWLSTDGNLTYDIVGLSLVSVVIMGTGEKEDIADDDKNNIRFIGILSSLFPD